MSQNDKVNENFDVHAESDLIAAAFVDDMLNLEKIVEFGDDIIMRINDTGAAFVKIQTQFNDVSRRAIYESTVQKQDFAKTLTHFVNLKDKLNKNIDRNYRDSQILYSHQLAGQTLDTCYDQLTEVTREAALLQIAFRSNQKKLSMSWNEHVNLGEMQNSLKTNLDTAIDNLRKLNQPPKPPSAAKV